VKKILYSILIISFISIILIKNVVYADIIAGPLEIINYSPLYYIAIIVVIAIVVGISILILKNIYKNNQLEKEKNEKGEEK
jgi:hypothetical protein